MDALAELHSRWVAANLESASARFDPAARPERTDYPEHHVDLDADPVALDDFDEQAMAILGGAVERSGYNHSQPRDGEGKWARTGRNIKEKLNLSDQDLRWLSTAGHLALDIAGWVPGWGEPADLVNAAWYLAEKDFANAALSAFSAIPVAGTATGVTKALKGVKSIAKTAKTGRQLRNTGRLITHRSEGVETREAFGIDLGSEDAGQRIVDYLRANWGKDPRPWQALYVQLSERVGPEEADLITRQMWTLVHGEMPDMQEEASADD